MPSSQHPHRSAAHQLQHPEHASYLPSPRSAAPYASTTRPPHTYRSVSTASSPDALNGHGRTNSGTRNFHSLASAHTLLAPTHSPKQPQPPSPPTKRRKPSHPSPPSSRIEMADLSAQGASSPDGKPSSRVAKACQPCSTKKRRCDGRQPQCSVCQVLSTPCTYNHTGLKRGPPKGFRAGPKESARAKLIRTLETTLRDLVNHLGKEEASSEIVRVSGERQLPLIGLQNSQQTERRALEGRSHSDVDLIETRSSSRFKIAHLTSTSRPLSTPCNDSRLSDADADGDGDGDERAAEAEEDVIGETRQGELVYRGSSSGIGILQRQHRAESPSAPVTMAANRSAASSSSAPYGGRLRNDHDPTEKAQHPRAPVFLPISSPRPFGDADTPSSQDRSPRSNKLTATRDPSNFRGMYPGSSRDDPASALAEDPAVSNEENDRLFRYYWQGFHPFYPILYKPWFVGFSREELQANLEPSLLYAIYAIGACVVPANTAHCVTTEHESSLQKLNLERAQAFCDAAERYVLAKGLRPDIASIQTCWLLSLYSHGTGDLSRAWNFQNLASSMAVDMGLHRWPIYRPEIVQDRVQRETRIRIIWHCYIVDKLLCAEMGRPVGLRAKDIDVPLLSETEEDEFELWSDQIEMQPMEHADARTNSATCASPRRLHAPSCLNWGVHLFKIVERILDEVHSLRRKALLRRQGKEQVLADLDRQLTDWKDKLPPHLHLDHSTTDGPFPSFFALNLWYYTARLLLHRPFIPQEEGLAMSKVLCNDSHRQSTIAANTICDLLEASSRDIVDRLSTDLGYCLFTAAVMFVFNARLPDAKIAEDARRRYGLCMQWLKKLADTWPAASAHRMLLDGFAVVGEDASKQGADAPRRRPSTAALQAAGVGSGLSTTSNTTSKVSSWIAETEGAWDVSSPNQLSGSGANQTASRIRGSVPARDSAIQQHSNATTDMAIEDQSVDTRTADNLGALSESWNKTHGGSTVTVEHNVHNAGVGVTNNLMDFAPGIFDVESFFWNENAAAAPTLMGMNFNPALPINVLPAPGQHPQSTVTYGGFNNPMSLANFDQVGNAPATMAYVPSLNQQQHESSQGGQGGVLGRGDGQGGMQSAPVSATASQTNDSVQNATSANATQQDAHTEAAPEREAEGEGEGERLLNASPFAFNSTNQSLGEFWSMLELPPAFLQQ